MDKPAAARKTSAATKKAPVRKATTSAASRINDGVRPVSKGDTPPSLTPKEALQNLGGPA